MKQSCFSMCEVIMLFYTSLPVWSDINKFCTVVDRWRFYVFIVDHWVQKVWPTFLDFTVWWTFWFCDFTEYTQCIYRKCTGKGWDCKTDWNTGLSFYSIFGMLWSSSSVFPMIHIFAFQTRITNHKTYSFIDVCVIYIYMFSYDPYV